VNGTVEGTATVTVHEEDSDDNEDGKIVVLVDGTSQSGPVLTTINVSPPAVTLNVVTHNSLTPAVTTKPIMKCQVLFSIGQPAMKPLERSITLGSSPQL
jgi:hypothetical protein